MNLRKIKKQFLILNFFLLLCVLVPTITTAQSLPQLKIEKQTSLEGNQIEDEFLKDVYSNLKNLDYSYNSGGIEKKNEKSDFKSQGVSAELLSNNGFELGYSTAHWWALRDNGGTLEDNYNIIIENNAYSANGSWFAYLDYLDVVISKEFTLPSNATSVNLDYNEMFITSGCTTGSNYMFVLLYDNTNAESVQILDSFDANENPSESEYSNVTVTSVDLSNRAGHEMQLWFYGGKEQAECGMTLYIDDVYLNANTTNTASVYRFWSNSKQGHFFTISEAEKDFIIANDSSWTYEGVAYQAFISQEANTTPVYRFWSQQKQHHFFTVSQAEKEFIQANDPSWAYEGVAYYAYAIEQANTTPVYRFWSQAKQGHFFTVSQSEKEFIEANDPSWSYEGIAWYVPE